MRRVLWLTVSFLMMLSLVIAACAPAAAPKQAVPKEEGKKITVIEKEEAAVKKEEVKEATAKPADDRPKYGGILTIPQPTWVNKYDIAVSPG